MTRRSDFVYDHHSDYYYDPIRPLKRSSSANTFPAYAIITLIFAYYLLHFLDLPVLSLPELLWNALVRISPDALIARLDKEYKRNDRQVDGATPSTIRAQALAHKSEAMRRIVGLEGPGVISYLPRARSLSNILTPATSEPRVKSLPGLGNWDNSCYQNSVIQGLAALRSLSAFLERFPPPDETTSHSTSQALRGITEKLNDPLNAGKRLWTPAVLKSMNSWQQQDAQEYFSKVFDEVEKESSKLPQKPSSNAGLRMVKGLAGHTALRRNDSGEKISPSPPTTSLQSLSLETLHHLPSELQSTIIRNPLSGLLAQRVGCLQCGYVEGLSLIPFNCLTLPLGAQWEYDIRTCLDDYTALEHISDIECPKCTLLRHQGQLSKIHAELTSKASDDPGASSSRQTLLASVTTRLGAVAQALEDEDFADTTLLKKCQIPAKSRVTVTKSKQAVVARMPKALVMHVNRSNFDELTGVQSKNYANVRFPLTLDLSPWCLGNGAARRTGNEVENWELDPSRSMLGGGDGRGATYSLRAVITHRGRHENGHYICHRKSRFGDQGDGEKWWRLSDDTVTSQSEGEVLSEGGVFMLFYELDESVLLASKPKESHAIEALLSTDESLATTSLAEKGIDLEVPSQNTIKGDPSLALHSASELATAKNDPLSPSPPVVQTSEPIATPNSPTTYTAPEAQESSPEPDAPEEPMPDLSSPKKENLHLAPRMRTASSRGDRSSIGKVNRAMANVSSMVTAN